MTQLYSSVVDHPLTLLDITGRFEAARGFN
jgi:hypothetical protein